MQEGNFTNEELSHVDYSVRQVFGFKFFLIFFILFVIGFIITFPLKDKIESNLRSALANNPQCPIHFSDVKYHLFFPSIELTNILVPSRCSKATLKDLNITSAILGLGGVSFSPLGIVSSVKVNLLKEPIDAKIVLGINQIAVKMDRSSINLPDLMKLLREPKAISGDAELSMRLIFKDQKINEGEMRLQSENLVFPAQSIKGFDVPTMDLNVLDLIVDIPEDSNNYNISTLRIGSQGAPLRVKGNGVIQANDKNFNQSKLNVELQVAPSQKLMEQFLILESLLQAYSNKDGFYRIKLEGRISAPNVKSF